MITLAECAIADAGSGRADVICFPECCVPGYRGLGHVVPPPDREFLERASATIARAARAAHVAVVLGTERFVDDASSMDHLTSGRSVTFHSTGIVSGR